MIFLLIFQKSDARKNQSHILKCSPNLAELYAKQLAIALSLFMPVYVLHK